METRLDWVVANACFFERLFARADVTSDMKHNRPTVDLERKMQALRAEDQERIDQVLPAMLDRKAFATLFLRQNVPLMVALGKSFEEGQTFINGVYFSAQAAPAVMNWLASLQAQASQDNVPANA